MMKQKKTDEIVDKNGVDLMKMVSFVLLLRCSFDDSAMGIQH